MGFIEAVMDCLRQGKTREEIIAGMCTDDAEYLVDCALESIAIAESANTPEEEALLAAEVFAKRRRKIN